LFRIYPSVRHGQKTTGGIKNFKPGVFGEIPREPFVWLIRLIGVLLIILGITFLAKKRKEASHN